MADETTLKGVVLLLKKPQDKIQKLLIPFSFLTVFVIISMSILFIGWAETWSYLPVPTMSPHFADMRTIQGAEASISLGLNPQIENPGDPWGRRMNYPYIWIYIAQFLNFESEVAFSAAILLYLMFSAFCIFLLLARCPNFLCLLFCISGAMLLAFERGNNDVLIFAMIYMAAISPGIISVVLIILASILKIFPVVAGIIFATSLRAMTFFLFFSILFIACIYPELGLIKSGIPQGAGLSYGSYSVSLSFDHFGISISSHLISVVLALAAVILTVFFPKTYNQEDYDYTNLKLFMMGASIYCSTFVITSNFDYRLIFIALCLPFLSERPEPINIACLLLSIISANFILLAEIGSIGLAINLASKIALFVLLLHLLIKIISGNLRKFISSGSGEIEEAADQETAGNSQITSGG